HVFYFIRKKRRKKRSRSEESLHGRDYAEGMQAYRVWDLEKKKTKEVSFYFCLISEGYFPFKDRRNWPSQAEPLSFFPSLKLFSLPQSGSFSLSLKKKKDVLERNGIRRAAERLTAIGDEAGQNKKEKEKVAEESKEKKRAEEKEREQG